MAGLRESSNNLGQQAGLMARRCERLGVPPMFLPACRAKCDILLDGASWLPPPKTKGRGRPRAFGRAYQVHADDCCNRAKGICREAGACVARNVAVADMNVDNALADGRRIEVVANGLQAFHGQQLAIDATCISPISRAGAPHPGTRTDPGRAAQHAELRKRRRYPELTAARRCRLVVVAVEVGGRWEPDARQLIRALARERSTEAPPWVRAAACAGWTARWAAVVAVGVQRALATSLLELPPAGDTLTGTPPDLPDLLADTRWELPAGPQPPPSPRPLKRRRQGCRANTMLAARPNRPDAYREKGAKEKKKLFKWGLATTPAKGIPQLRRCNFALPSTAKMPFLPPAISNCCKRVQGGKFPRTVFPA